MEDVQHVELDALYPMKIRRLGDAIDAVTRPKLMTLSALDVGCGEGMLVARLRELGWNAHGVDGSTKAVDLRVCEWVKHGDVRVPWVALRWPLVVCTEVAEHVPAEYADTLVRNIARSAGELIVWSAAPPGQPWPGHVNMQPPGYWLDRFKAFAWEPSEGLSEWLRREMRSRDAQHAGAAESFHVLAPEQVICVPLEFGRVCPQ